MEQLQSLDKLYGSISMTLIKNGSEQHAWKYVCRLSHNGQMESFDYSWGKGLKDEPKKEDLIASLLSDWDCISQCGIDEEMPRLETWIETVDEWENEETGEWEREEEEVSGYQFEQGIDYFMKEFGYDSYEKAEETVNQIRENIEKLRRLFTEEELNILKGESND